MNVNKLKIDEISKTNLSKINRVCRYYRNRKHKEPLKMLIKELIEEGPCEKMSKSKKNVIEPDEILKSYGIDATRIFMISDSPPDREIEWTDEGIQSSKNLTHRIERYFSKEMTSADLDTEKKIEIFEN